MQYVISAEDYFKSLNESNRNLGLLTTYIESIPTSFFEAIERTDWSKLDDFFNSPVDEKVSDVKLTHQLFLLDQIDDINDIIQKEDFLARIGYDTITLRESGAYLETVQTLTEGLLGSVWDFIKSTVADPDPIEMTLNVIRLVLDIIGIVPFTWAGVPIDIVSNLLSALISIYKKDWFSAILSLASAVDVSHVSAVVTKFLRPAAPIVNKILPVLFRSGAETVALDKAVINARKELIELGGKDMVDNVISLFTGIGKFLTGSAVSVIKLIATFVESAVNRVTPNMAKKYTAKLPQLIDKLGANVSTFGKNFETATKILRSGSSDLTRASSDVMRAADVAAAGEKRAIQAKAFSDAIAAGKGSAEANLAARSAVADYANKLVDKYATDSGKYLSDLRDMLKETTTFQKKISKLPKSQQDIWLAAKMENELIGQAKLSTDAILKDPTLANRLSQLGWKPGSSELIAMARRGDETGVKKFFETFLTDPTLAKNLSKEEIRALTPFFAKPKAFVDGVRNMDGALKAAKAMEGLSRAMQGRGVSLLKLLNFLSRYVWQYYGNMVCLLEAGANDPDKPVAASTAKLAAGVSEKSSPISSVNEEEDNSDSQEQAQATDPNQLDPLVVKELDLNKRLVDELAAKRSKADCGMLAAANSATVAKYLANYPGSTANLAKTPNSGEDPKARADAEKNNTEYTKKVLKSMGLDSKIDPQHAIDGLSPTAQLAFADVWDAENGVISVNTADESRMTALANKMVERGVWTRKEADQAVKDAMNALETGNFPETPLPKNLKSSTNEGLFKTRGFEFNYK